MAKWLDIERNWLTFCITVVIEITLQTHSVFKQSCLAYHNTIVSKYCIFKDQTLLPLESCRHAIISAPNDCLLVNGYVDGWLTQELEAFMFSRLTRVGLFKQRLAEAIFFLLPPINQRKQIERVQMDPIKFDRIFWRSYYCRHRRLCLSSLPRIVGTPGNEIGK